MPPLIATALVLLATIAAGSARPGLPIDPAWSASPIWDDGLAEIARYDSRRPVYGIERRFETILITVKEEFDRARAVKADPPYEGRDLITVLKLNALARIETENYPYNYMTSVFVRRDDPRVLVKLSQSSQEWCGTTFQQVVTHDGPARLEYHSYFDGEADGRAPLHLDGAAVLEDQLMLLVRAARLEAGIARRFRLHGSLVSNRAVSPGALDVEAVLAGRETLATPAGDFVTDRIEIREQEGGSGEPLLTYWVESAPRRALVGFASRDGRSLRLTGIQRRDYWSRGR